jgi:2-C-methyl-D-erythritol 4-phosphate cytidylyltransferase
MGSGTNKQFLELRGKPILSYSLTAFEQCDAVDAIVVVRRPDYAEQAEQLALGFQKVVALTDGGVERQNSVWNGLDKCPSQTEIVAVHDGARPLVTPQLIAATIQSARTHGTGIAATKVVDTIKEADDERTILRTVDRTRLWAVQTPQTAHYELLRRAYDGILKQGVIVTDEAAAIERIGGKVKLVDTPFLNLKITTPSDLAMAEALLRVRS